MKQHVIDHRTFVHEFGARQTPINRRKGMETLPRFAGVVGFCHVERDARKARLAMMRMSIRAFHNFNIASHPLHNTHDCPLHMP